MRNCIMAGDREEKASAGGVCFLWITSYIYEVLQQQHANEILEKTTEQESSASPLLWLISVNLYLFLSI